MALPCRDTAPGRRLDDLRSGRSAHPQRFRFPRRTPHATVRPYATLRETMTDIDRPTSRDPSPDVVARHERRSAERMARRDRSLIERFIRLIGWRPERCQICGASTEWTRNQRCRGACAE
jgi:hypothetical protein